MAGKLLVLGLAFLQASSVFAQTKTTPVAVVPVVSFQPLGSNLAPAPIARRGIGDLPRLALDNLLRRIPGRSLFTGASRIFSRGTPASELAGAAGSPSAIAPELGAFVEMPMNRRGESAGMITAIAAASAYGDGDKAYWQSKVEAQDSVFRRVAERIASLAGRKQ